MGNFNISIYNFKNELKRVYEHLYLEMRNGFREAFISVRFFWFSDFIFIHELCRGGRNYQSIQSV